MHYEYIKNCAFCTESTEHIDCIVKFSHINEEVIFTASKNDVEAHGREIYERIMNGEFGPIAPFVPRVITQEEKAEFIRAQRGQKLFEMDTIVSNPLRWASFSTELQAAWAAYRQALLDVPAQPGFPDNIVWPTPPQ